MNVLPFGFSISPKITIGVCNDVPQRVTNLPVALSHKRAEIAPKFDSGGLPGKS